MTNPKRYDWHADGMWCTDRPDQGKWVSWEDYEKLRSAAEPTAEPTDLALVQEAAELILRDGSMRMGSERWQVALFGPNNEGWPRHPDRSAEPAAKRVCPDSEDGNHVLKQDGPFSVVYCDACGMNRGYRTQEPPEKTG